jgi:hypothetical protein
VLSGDPAARGGVCGDKRRYGVRFLRRAAE